MEAINNILQWVVDLIWNIGRYLYELFLGEDGFVWYPLDFALGTAESVVSEMPDAGATIQSVDGGSFSYTLGLVARLNAFFPIVESGILLLMFLVFVIIFLFFKYVMKMTPLVG